MTYHQALKAPTHRPLYRRVGRVVIDLCHALLLVGVMTLPASLASMWKDHQKAQQVTQKGATK